jgi:16S rRNA (guanine527-N7)-methyltransferase
VDPELGRRVPAKVTDILRRSAALGFLGGMSLPDQIDHSLGFVHAVESLSAAGPPARAIDLGSGGGIPGLVLAACWPRCDLVLLDASERRTAFLGTEVSGVAGFGNVEVVRLRAEEAGHLDLYRETFDLVTVRSFGTPAAVVECGSPLLVRGGVMIVSEPPDRGESSRWPTEGIAMVGMEVDRRIRFDDRFSYQVLRKTTPTPERYPRRVGVPAKRPLF